MIQRLEFARPIAAPMAVRWLKKEKDIAFHADSPRCARLFGEVKIRVALYRGFWKGLARNGQRVLVANPDHIGPLNTTLALKTHGVIHPMIDYCDGRHARCGGGKSRAVLKIARPTCAAYYAGEALYGLGIVQKGDAFAKAMRPNGSRWARGENLFWRRARSGNPGGDHIRRARIMDRDRVGRGARINRRIWHNAQYQWAPRR